MSIAQLTKNIIYSVMMRDSSSGERSNGSEVAFSSPVHEVNNRARLLFSNIGSRYFVNNFQ